MYTICGIEIGKNCAFALIDLNRNLIKIKSFKDEKLSDLIGEINKEGKVIIVATDVNPIPKKIRKIAAALQCGIFYPVKAQ